MLTQARLKELLSYDPETGLFTWIACTSLMRVKVGDIAGWPHNGGYWRIGIDRRTYKAHRIVWLYVTGEWPANEIDHIDGNRINNRFANLRDVTRSVNQQNQRRAQFHNKLGFFGVCRSHGRFMAQLRINGKQTYLGRFGTPEEAHIAYLAAKRIHHAGNTL